MNSDHALLAWGRMTLVQAGYPDVLRVPSSASTIAERSRKSTGPVPHASLLMPFCWYPSENVLEPTLVARVRLRGCTGARHRLRPRVSARSSESSQRPFVEQLAASSLGGALADNAQFMSATRTSRALKAARWPSALAGTAVSAGNCATDGQAACAPTSIRQLKTRSHCRASSTRSQGRQGRGRAHAHTDTPAQTGHSQGGRGGSRAAQRKGPSRERRQSYERRTPAGCPTRRAAAQPRRRRGP